MGSRRRKCVFKQKATQRSHVVATPADVDALASRVAARAAREPPGPLLTRYALALAAVLLKGDRPDLVNALAATLDGPALLETLKSLPDELEELSTAGAVTNLRGAFEMHGLRGADRGDAAGRDVDIPSATERADEDRPAPTIERKSSLHGVGPKQKGAACS